MTLRVSVSDLESFRRYRTDEDMPLHVLLRQLRREESPGDKMIAGSALHRLLETAGVVSLNVAEIDGHRFTFNCDGDVVLAPIREMRGSKTYTVNGELVTLAARVDTIDGVEVVDHKLTSQFDAEKYCASYQWRAYLSIFNAQKFTFNVFVGKLMRVDEAGIVEWDIKEFHPLTLYRYPELEADLMREVTLYLEFAKQHLISPLRAA